MASIIPIFFALLGLSFLIFIHEFGHFWMARRVGMKVDTFSIGFGRPIFSWIRDGVKWQLCWFLVGGYVKIAGMDNEQKTDPYLIKDGFFGKTPLQRILVAIAGPLTNILFALLAFTLIWAVGGRIKPFSEFTHKIGYVDPTSELYSAGIRPGDEISSYDGVPFSTSTDHLTAPITAAPDVTVEGFKVNYLTGEKTPFSETVKAYPNPRSLDKDILTVGITQPAMYLVYDKFPGGKDNPLPDGSPMRRSGLEYGDRVVWVNGEFVYALEQLKSLLNEDKVLVTVERDNKTFLRRVPRVAAEEIRPDKEFRDELADWKFEAGLVDKKPKELWVLPYNLNYDAVVEGVMRFVDPEDEKKAFPTKVASSVDAPLEKGDRIIAVQGTAIKRAYQLLQEIQVKRANIIVKRGEIIQDPVALVGIDAKFDHSIDWKAVVDQSMKIGTPQEETKSGVYVLLKPVSPKPPLEFPTSLETKSLQRAEWAEQRRAIETLGDSERRTELLARLDREQNEVMLGLPVQDERVLYNPGPLELFCKEVTGIFRTIEALFSGSLGLKFLSGPVGIIHVVQKTSTASLSQSLWWLGFISLNLGFLNLLPIPVLDGGTILFSFFELITGKRVNAKLMEMLMFLFMTLFILLFFFLTYQDVYRIVERIFIN